MENYGRNDFEMLKNEILAEIKGLISRAHQTGQLLNSQEVRKIFRISETKLYEMRRDGKIPFLKVDGKYLYDYNELMNAFRNAGQ